MPYSRGKGNDRSAMRPLRPRIRLAYGGIAGRRNGPRHGRPSPPHNCRRPGRFPTHWGRAGGWSSPWAPRRAAWKTPCRMPRASRRGTCSPRSAISLICRRAGRAMKASISWSSPPAGARSSRKFAAQPARVEALDQWVRAGGTLVLCGGENADAALAKDSPLARFVPGRYDGIRHLHGEQVGRLGNDGRRTQHDSQVR